MARPVTITELTSRALRRAKMENSQFPEDGEVDRLVREAIAELYDKLIEARGAHYYLCGAECQTVANMAAYPLPADFYKLAAVYVNQNPGAAVMPTTALAAGHFVRILTTIETQQSGWQLIHPFMDQEAPGLMNASGGSAYASYYRLRGYQEDVDIDDEQLDLLEIRPLPAGPFLVRIEYIPKASTESYGGPPANDPVVNGINGFEEFVVVRVAMTLLDEEESDTRHLERDLARVEARIQALADNRDSGRPQRIQDTQGLIDGGALLGIDIRPRW
jgi:hypothetical protein